MMGEVRIYSFDIRLKRPLKQEDCPLQNSNFIRDLGLFLYWDSMPGHAVRSPFKGVDMYGETKRSIVTVAAEDIEIKG